MAEHNVTWSHSSLKDFQNCPRKYYEVKVLEKYPREETEATAYGTQLHEQCELHIRDGRPLDQNFRFLQPVLDKLKAMPGRKYPEYEMALTKDLRVCNFHAPDRWVRGIADLIIVDDDNLTARVFDYKSGSDKYPDTSQLELMALMISNTSLTSAACRAGCCSCSRTLCASARSSWICRTRCGGSTAKRWRVSSRPTPTVCGTRSSRDCAASGALCWTVVLMEGTENAQVK